MIGLPTASMVGATENPLLRGWRAMLDSLAILLSSAVAGAALVAVCFRFGEAGPVVFFMTALLPLVTLLLFQQPVLGVLLVFASYPVVALAPWTAELTVDPVQAAVAVSAGLVVIQRLAVGRGPLDWSGPLWWAVALFAWALIALPSSSNVELGIKQIFALAGAIVFAAMVLTCCERAWDLRRVLGGLIAVGVLAALFALTSGVQPEASFGGAVISGRAVGTFNQPNQLGAFAAMVSMVAAGMMLGAESRLGRILAGVAFAVVFMALILSLSRGAWIGTALGGLLFVVALPRARRAVLVAAIPLAVLLAVAGSIAPETPELQVVGDRLQAFTTENPYDSRPKIWQEARRQVAADPWTGQGPGNFPVVSARSGSEADTVFADHAHNLLLNWAAEAGIPAAVLIVGVVSAVAIAARRARRSAIDREQPRHAALVVGIAAALITVMGQGLVDYPLKNAVIWFTVWGLVGALLAARRIAGPARA
ncbi:MAG: O-antigen ligase family protein [Actinomycetota bacterium]|nr:O-antigen ligase family protein [Actinomycetota bacterium]